MRWFLSALCALGALAALTAAVPVPEARPETLQDMQAQLPLEVQERLSALQLDEQQMDQVTRAKRTIAVLRQLFPGIGQTELNPEENQLAGAESQVNEVRAQYTDEKGFGYDQDAAASGGNDAPDPANVAVDDENAEDADRNKRQFNFSGGSGGGSGNFLFDIIRTTADRAARAAGTIYRLVAGTENLGLGVGVSASQTTTTRTNQTSTMMTNNGTSVLVTGGSSGGGAASEASTDASGATGVEKDDGYGAGIPGPVTRLFIIANRGIANLVQDLILRIAQTSERLVNFKARLITSII